MRGRKFGLRKSYTFGRRFLIREGLLGERESEWYPNKRKNGSVPRERVESMTRRGKTLFMAEPHLSDIYLYPLFIGRGSRRRFVGLDRTN